MGFPDILSISEPYHNCTFGLKTKPGGDTVCMWQERQRYKERDIKKADIKTETDRHANHVHVLYNCIL
jgi:hypothetical protein